MRNRVMVWLRIFRADQKGLSAVENGLAAVLIAVSVIGGASMVGPQLNDLYANIFNSPLAPLGGPQNAGPDDPSSGPPEEHPDSPFVSGDGEPEDTPGPVADSGPVSTSESAAGDP